MFDEKIYVAGHLGMVDSAIVRKLQVEGYHNIVTRGRSELDLRNQEAVLDFLKTEKPDQIYLAAAKVGGIYANQTYPAEFIYENLIVQANIINGAYLCGVKKLLFLGSSCIYPRMAKQPISEEELLKHSLEPTNEPYAIAKIAGIKMCESYNRQYEALGIDYRSIMPTNLYGPGDNYHLENSHVIPGLIRRIHEAKINESESVRIWGTGQALREFLYIDDMADACLHVMNLPFKDYRLETEDTRSYLNVGSGVDISIRELGGMIKQIVGYRGELCFDHLMPDGTPKKLLDSTRINKLGWSPKTKLRDGLQMTYDNFKTRYGTIKT